jgi:hypothetical protein
VPVPDDVLGNVTDADAERIQQIHDRWKLYEGDHPPTLQVLPGDVDDNVTRNSVGTIVDTGVEFLFAKGATVQVTSITDTAGDEDAANAAQAIVDATLERSGGSILFTEFATGGAIAGHATLKLVPAPGDPATGEHRIIALDPATVTAFWPDDDVTRAIAYRIMWTTHDDENRPVVLREDHVQQDDGRWFVRRWRGKAGASTDYTVRTRFSWVPEDDGVVWDFPLIADCKNLPDLGRYYGRPDITLDIERLNMAANRVASNASKTLRHFAHPQPYAIGKSTQAMQAMLDASIGGMLCLPEGSQVGTLELQADGLDASAAFVDAVEAKLFETARIPQVALGKVKDIGQLAGVALLIMYRPLLSKTETKQETYGPAIVQIVRSLLLLAGVDPTRFHIGVDWPDPLPKNDKDEADTALTLLELGVSKRTILERLGFDPDVEEQRRQQEQDDPMGDTRGLADRMLEAAASPDQGAASVDPAA